MWSKVPNPHLLFVLDQCWKPLSMDQSANAIEAPLIRSSSRWNPTPGTQRGLKSLKPRQLKKKKYKHLMLFTTLHTISLTANTEPFVCKCFCKASQWREWTLEKDCVEKVMFGSCTLFQNGRCFQTTPSFLNGYTIHERHLINNNDNAFQFHL